MSRDRWNARNAALSRRRLLRTAALGAGLPAAAAVLGPVSRFGPGPTALAQDAAAPAGLYGYEIEPPANEGGIMVWANPIPILLDTSLLTTGWNGLSEALVELDPTNFEPTPLLAESWEANDDATEWTIALRQGVLFHDGQPFTAADVKFTLEMHGAEGNAAAAISDTAGLAANIDRVDIIDDHNVKVFLKEPNVDFAMDLSLFPIAAEHVVGGVPAEDLLTHPASTGTDPSQVVFTGPFKFQEHVDGEQMTLARFDEYWNGRPNLDALVFRVVEDQSAQAAQLLSGQLDASQGIDPGVVAQFEGTDFTVTPVYEPYWIGYSYHLDAEETPIYADKRVRHALLHAIDREQIVETVLFGYGRVQETVLPPENWANDPEGVTVRYPFDPKRAAELLDEAGWSLGSDGVREREGLKLRPRFFGRAGSIVDETMVVLIQQYWADIGVEMQPELATDAEIAARVIDPAFGEKDYDSALWYFAGAWGTTVNMSFNFGCEPEMGVGNRYGYCNPRIDELQREILAEQDRERRIELATEMQNIILEDLPVAPITQEVLPIPVSNRFHNVFPNASDFFFNCETWWVDA